MAVKSKEIELSTGRKIKIREISIDNIDDLNDIAEVHIMGDVKTIKNVNRAQTAWIRNGLAGGDFEGWKPNGGLAPDSVIRQLKEMERAELVVKIKEAQRLNPSKPS